MGLPTSNKHTEKTLVPTKMDTRVLETALTISKIFASSPFSPDARPKSILEKVHSAVVVLLLTLGVAASLHSREFYGEDIAVKMIVCVFRDAALYAFNLYAIVALGFFKLEARRQLGSNLGQVRDADGSSWRSFGFVAANFAYLGISAFTVAESFENEGWEYFSKHNVEHVQNYVKFLYKLLICVVAGLVLGRYENLNFRLSNYVRVLPPKDVLSDIKDFESEIVLLHKTVDLCNDIFGWPLALLVCYTALDFLIYIDLAIFSDDEEYTLWILIIVLTVALDSISTVTVIFMCDNVTREAGKLVELAFELRSHLGFSSSLVNDESVKFTRVVLEHIPRFTAEDFFYIERSTILNMLGTITTFLIIIIQFRTEDK